jgi:hypothetical protein
MLMLYGWGVAEGGVVWCGEEYFGPDFNENLVVPGGTRTDDDRSSSL